MIQIRERENYKVWRNINYFYCTDIEIQRVNLKFNTEINKIVKKHESLSNIIINCSEF